MEEKDIVGVLGIILESLGDRDFVWRIEGSANLLIQGVNVSVKDLDITTDDQGLDIFRDALKDFIVKDFFSEKINGVSLVCDINGFEVEINSYGDRELNMFDKNERILWHGLQVPILPLEYAKKFYELIDRKEKVDLIDSYLKNI